MLLIKEGIMLEAVLVKDRVDVPFVQVLGSPSFPAYSDREPSLYCRIGRPGSPWIVCRH